MNQPLFSINATFTEKAFVRFNKYIMLHRLNYRRNVIICNVILLLIFSGILVDDINLEGIPVGSIMMFLIIVFVNWRFYVSPTNKSKKAYRQNKAIKDAAYSLNFYEDHYEIECNDIKSSVPFDKLYEIIETGTDYYLMSSKISGVIIPKKKCSEGFADFIHKIRAANK